MKKCWVLLENKIKEKTDQIGREFCLLCCHEIAGEERLNWKVVQKGTLKTEELKNKEKDSFTSPHSRS